MKLDAPFYSQWLDVADADWQRRACGVAALKMAMLALHSFSEEGDIGLDDLIKRGVELGAYKPGVGWVHDGLVSIAKECGFQNSFRKEWQIERSPTSLTEIEGLLQSGTPVIASVKSETGGHLILLTGFEKDGDKISGFYCNDPDARTVETGKNKFILITDFLPLWKGRIIVVAK